jgi:HAD superfamily hydrolase (TIGR01459 family)
VAAVSPGVIAEQRVSGPLPPFSPSFRAIAPGYDVLLCDVWGVVHNGIAATPEACEALRQFRAHRGTVILITNAPRPCDYVKGFITRLGVPADSYDGIVTSGDVTMALIAQRPGVPVHHIGPARDRPMFDDFDAPLVPIERAEYVVCSGLFDDTKETPADYADAIAAMRARTLPMICANPDIVVERGKDLVYCAGAIAEAYAQAGGEVFYAGKPYRPIYEQAMAAAQATRGCAVDRARVLAIGDSVRTDLKGADAFGVDCLFVTAGIHAEELGERDNPDASALAAIFAAADSYPKMVMQRLRW